jgi:membrane-bound lytic murein transglycosylase C
LAAAVNSSKISTILITSPLIRFDKNLAELPGKFQKDIAALDALMNSFSFNIEKKWGKAEIRIAGKSNYVKYIDNYQSRAEVDFAKGKVTISTVSSTEPKKHLKNAIVTTLLTPDDLASVDLYSSSSIKLEGRPFLYQQVVDQDEKPIQWSWRANRFADYLIANQLKTSISRLSSMNDEGLLMTNALVGNE